MAKHEIFGIIFDYEPTDYNELLEGYVYTPDTSSLFTKKEYHHFFEDEPKYNFHYKYKVEATNMEAYEGKGVAYNVYLVVSPKDVCKEKLNDTKRCCGVDEVTYEDLSDCGYQILMHYEMREDDTEKDIDYRLSCIASIIECTDCLRGFHFDRAQNRIGTSGWMMLDELLFNKDSIKATLKKYKTA